MNFNKNTKVAVESGRVPVPVKKGEVFIYVDTVTPGVRTSKGVRGWIGSKSGSPVLATADARDVEAE